MNIELTDKRLLLLMMALEAAANWALRQPDGDIDDLIENEETRSESLIGVLRDRINAAKNSNT